MKLKPPKHLKVPGRALYTAIAAEYGIDDAAGLALLTIAGECQDRLRQAQAELEENGPVLTDRYGGLKPHPAIAIEKDSRNGLLATLKQLNLDIEPIRDRRGRPASGFGIRGVQ